MQTLHRAVFLSALVVASAACTETRPAASAASAAPPAAPAPAWPAATGPALTALVLGDFGTGGPGQRRVAQVMATHVEDAAQAVLLTVGDNIYPHGVTRADDPVLDERIRNVYASLGVDIWPTLGNHDHRGDPLAQVAYAARFPRWKMPGRYYTVRRAVGAATVQFIALDTQALLDGDEAQLAFLDAALAEDRPTFRVVFGHHPLIAHGPHGPTDDLVPVLRPRFATGAVDVYLAGHEHTLEVTVDDTGLVHVVSGGGAGDDNPYPLRTKTPGAFAATGGGFAKLRCGEAACDIGLFDDDGAVLYVHRLTRPAPTGTPVPPVVAPAAPPPNKPPPAR